MKAIATTLILLLCCTVAQAGTFQEADEARDAADTQYDDTIAYYEREVEIDHQDPNLNSVEVATGMFQVYMMIMPPNVLNAVTVKFAAMNAAVVNGNQDIADGNLQYQLGEIEYGNALTYWQNNNQGDPVVILTTQNMLDDAIQFYVNAGDDYIEAYADYYLAVDKAEEAIAIMQEWLEQ